MSELRIHTYSAAEPGIFVHSYLLDAPNRVILVDANLLVSDARSLASRLAASRFLSGAPLSWLVDLGADAVATELAQHGGTDERE